MKLSTVKKLVQPKAVLNVFLSLLILVASQLPSQRASDLLTYVIFSTVLVFVVFFVNYTRLRRSSESVVFLILPVLFLVGSLGVIAAVSSVVLKVFLGLVVTVLFYLYESYFPKNHAPFFEEMFSLVTGLLLLIFLWGFYFFFDLPWWLLLVLISLFFGLLFWQTFYKMKRDREKSPLAVLLSVILLSQISWAALYLPVHFLTASVIGFSVFYLIYTLSRLHFREKLSRDKVYFQVGMIAILIILSLLSSPWGP